MTIERNLLGTVDATAATEKLFSADLFTGNNASKTITNNVNVSTYGGLVWIKCRTGLSHVWQDTVRGVSATLLPNFNYGSATYSSAFVSFNTNGFTLGTDSNGSWNTNGAAYISYTFRKKAGFFDIVTYTGNGAANRVISHSLGATPGLIVVKRLDGAANWVTRHISGYSPSFNIVSYSYGYGYVSDMNSTTFTTGPSVFDLSQVNATGYTYVAYLFGHDTTSTGIIQCGLYTGNGSSSGPSVTLGWRPQFLIIKNAGNVSITEGDWNVFDTQRGIPTGAADPVLWINSANGEASTLNLDLVDLSSTGFSIKSSNADVNTSGTYYEYIAIRE